MAKTQVAWLLTGCADPGVQFAPWDESAQLPTSVLDMGQGKLGLGEPSLPKGYGLPGGKNGQHRKTSETTKGRFDRSTRPGAKDSKAEEERSRKGQGPTVPRPQLHSLPLQMAVRQAVFVTWLIIISWVTFIGVMQP